MKRYIQPFTEIIPLMTIENLLLGGSDQVNPLQPGDDIIIDGDERETNSTSRSLWDEE